MSKVKIKIILLFVVLAVFLLILKAFQKEGCKEVVYPDYLSEKYIKGDYLWDKRFSDVKFFPMADFFGEEENANTFSFEDSYGASRSYGGDRIHEGTDIMTGDNIPGTYPVVSVCDGMVTNIGWLELGGYRVGITSDNGVYYYYAHLSRYDSGVKCGERVLAGQIIGYAGDSGYGPEGTTGQFAVHLHFGIYLDKEDGTQIAINPYPLLHKMKEQKIVFFDE